jgi:phosphoribosylformylglycinamidine synthase subunit PurS
VSSVRAGKYLRLTVEATSSSEAEQLAVGACEKLLTNTVIEEYRVSVAETANN